MNKCSVIGIDRLIVVILLMRSTQYHTLRTETCFAFSIGDYQYTDYDSEMILHYAKEISNQVVHLLGNDIVAIIGVIEKYIENP